MKTTYVTLNGGLYRLTGKAIERVLLAWYRTNERPDFVGWSGVTYLGAAANLDEWTMGDVEAAMLATLKVGRQAPAGEAPPEPSPRATEPAGKRVMRRRGIEQIDPPIMVPD